jgi:protein SCO1/2
MAGRPTLLVFADYTCNTLCSPILTRIGEAMAQSGLPPRGYRLVVLGLDPKDGPRAAARMKQERIADPAVAASAVLLSGDEATVRRAADAVGYRYAYDAAHDQFAHPAAVLALTADGRLARVLSGLGTTTDLRLALVEAGEGRIGTLRDRVRLLCYGFDPSVGVYTPSVHRALAAVSALTVLMLGAAIGWLSLRRARPS